MRMREDKVITKEEEAGLCDNENALAVIDWPACAYLYKGDSSYVCQLLSLLATDLKSRQCFIRCACIQQNLNVLGHELHFLFHRVSDLRLPELERAIHRCRDALRSSPFNQKGFFNACIELQEAIEHFLQFWEQCPKF